MLTKTLSNISFWVFTTTGIVLSVSLSAEYMYISFFSHIMGTIWLATWFILGEIEKVQNENTKRR